METLPRRTRKTGLAAAAGHDVRVEERRSRALDLRKAGGTYEQIGRSLGVSKMQAFRDVQAALHEVVRSRSETAEELLALELQRLDALWLALYPKAQAGDHHAALVALKVSQRRAALLGLDAPTRTQLYGLPPLPVAEGPETASLTDAELRERLRQAIAVLQTSVGPLPEPEPPKVADPAPMLSPEEQYRRELERRAALSSSPVRM